MKLDPERKKQSETLGYWVTIVFMVAFCAGVLVLFFTFMFKLIMYVWNGVL